jgi:hypothetical protein
MKFFDERILAQAVGQRDSGHREAEDGEDGIPIWRCGRLENTPKVRALTERMEAVLFDSVVMDGEPGKSLRVPLAEAFAAVNDVLASVVSMMMAQSMAFTGEDGARRFIEGRELGEEVFEECLEPLGTGGLAVAASRILALLNAATYEKLLAADALNADGSVNEDALGEASASIGSSASKYEAGLALVNAFTRAKEAEARGEDGDD